MMPHLPSGKFPIKVFIAWLLGSEGVPTLSAIFMTNDLPFYTNFIGSCWVIFTREINGRKNDDLSVLKSVHVANPIKCDLILKIA